MHGREYDENERARAAAAEQVRRVAHEVVRGTHTEAELYALADELRARADAMAATPKRERDILRFSNPNGMEAPEDGGEFFNSPDRPVSGLANPWSIPLRCYRKGDHAVCDVEFGPGFEGAPTMAHGGFVAAVWDDLLGFLLILYGGVAFTASLTIGYKNPTPVGVPLRFEAWIDRIEGRKIWLAGECRDGDDQVLTTAEGLFIDATAQIEANLNKPT